MAACPSQSPETVPERTGDRRTGRELPHRLRQPARNLVACAASADAAWPEAAVHHSRTADFKMPDTLWARIVYDFVLAHRLQDHQSKPSARLASRRCIWPGSPLISNRLDQPDSTGRRWCVHLKQTSPTWFHGGDGPTASTPSDTASLSPDLPLNVGDTLNVLSS